MNSDRYELEVWLPIDVGADVLSPLGRLGELEKCGFRVISQGAKPTDIGVYDDLGAVAVTLAGTVVGAAAVKGAFDLLQIIISEACTIRRQRLEHKHELDKARLVANGSEVSIDLDDSEVALAR